MQALDACEEISEHPAGCLDKPCLREATCVLLHLCTLQEPRSEGFGRAGSAPRWLVDDETDAFAKGSAPQPLSKRFRARQNPHAS
eukprot:6472499-Amphidinium_carterae.1